MRHIHCVGIGGIGVSALAKWLLVLGERVTGSDASEGAQIAALRQKGISIQIGAEASHVAADTDLLIYSSAVSETHPERLEAKRRGIPQMNSFALLGELVRERDVVLVTGTHGKSTTTAMLSNILIEAGLDPTCFVGSVVPDFAEGNMRIGASNLVVIEGDEYDRHFLHFYPRLVILNNLEWDHTDHFPTFEELVSVFRQLLHQIKDGGTVCANADDAQVMKLVEEERGWFDQHGIRIRAFGIDQEAETRARDIRALDEAQRCIVESQEDGTQNLTLTLPGRMNVTNALAAYTAARACGAEIVSIARALQAFTGIWRRFERIKDEDGVLVISDYAHHPTAVRATLEAARSFFPHRRIVLCFEPHRQERTRDLFQEFVGCFAGADVLLLAEIWDMPNRETVQGKVVTSRDLMEAVKKLDHEQGVLRSVEYIATKEEALARLQAIKQKGDVILVAGAGSIYTIAKNI